MENKDNTTEVVETTSQEEVVEGSTEKTFTQEQLNSIVAKALREEKEKVKKQTELSNSELAERLIKVEEERAFEKEQQRIRDEILKATEVENKKNNLKIFLKERVQDQFIDNVFNLTILNAHIEDKSIDELKTKAEEVINSLPGVSKGTSTATTTLAANEVKIETNNEETKEIKFYTKSGTPLPNMTDEKFNKLSFSQKELIEKK